MTKDKPAWITGKEAFGRCNMITGKISDDLKVTGVRCKLVSNRDVDSFTNRSQDGIIETYIAVDPAIKNEAQSYVNPRHVLTAMVNIAHELHHAAVRTRLESVCKDSDTLFDSYVSRCYNEATYEAEYGSFTFEIEAERYAIRKIREYAEDFYDSSDIDGALLEYINMKAIEKRDTYRYPIYNGTGYESLDDALEALDEAYERSLANVKDFDRKGNCVKDAIDCDKQLKKGIRTARTGAEQATYAAAIVMSTYPDDPDWSDIRDDPRYDVEAIRSKGESKRALEKLKAAYNALSDEPLDGNGGPGGPGI